MRGARRKFNGTVPCPILVFFAKLSFFWKFWFRGARDALTVAGHPAQYRFFLPSFLFLISRGAECKFNVYTPGPISVFFAKLSFFQKKAESFLMRGIYGRI